jgi:triphosphatase
MRHGVAVVVANADALRDAPEAEHVHQARVALRRMRSAIRCFDPAGHDLPTRLVNRLHWLAQALGSARDWDVVLDSSLPAFLAHWPVSDNARKALVKATRRARARALGGAVRAVSSRRYAKLVLELAQWASTPASPSCDPLSRAAVPLLDDAADQLFSRARSFARHTANQRHEVRIRAKRLRYALDLLAVTLPERPVHDYIEALGELQDVLGELNDVVVAVECISGLDRGRRMKAALHDWLEQAEAAQLGAARRKLNALARRSRPWKSP